MMGKWFRKKNNVISKDGNNVTSKAGNVEIENDSSLQEEKETETILEAEKVNLSDTETRITYITHLYEQIKEAKKQCEDTKFDYGQATSYLKDIQLIDAAPDEARKVIRDVAEEIHELTQERNRIQKQKYKITDSQRFAIETNEEHIDDDVRKLQ